MLQFVTIHVMLLLTSASMTDAGVLMTFLNMTSPNLPTLTTDPPPLNCNITGYYGLMCGHKCHCKDGPAACDEDGVCAGNCTDGWSGPMCQIPCPVGTFGFECSQNCSMTCDQGLCETDTGFCFCAEDAPEVECKRRPDDLEDLVTSLWVTVCVLALVLAWIIICIGRSSPCSRRTSYQANQKRPVLRLVLGRQGARKAGDSDSPSSSGSPLSPAGLRSDTLKRRQPSRPAAGSLMPGKRPLKNMASSQASSNARSSHCVDGGKQEGRQRGSVSARQPPHPAAVAKHLENVMPGYKVHVDNQGQMKLVLKNPQDRPVIRESMARIMRQKVIKAQEKVRRKPGMPAGLAIRNMSNQSSRRNKQDRSSEPSTKSSRNSEK